MNATERLSSALIVVAAAGGSVPCGEYGGHQLWTSDDAGDRVVAADRCQVCPVLRECDRAAVENDERHHVWGGVDRTRSAKKASL